MNNKKKNILFLLHLPPPVHGSSIVGETIKNSILINSQFHGRYINLLLSRKVDDTGKIKTSKTFRFILSWFHLLGKLIHRRPNLFYFALTTTGAGFRKDVMLVSLLRLFRVKILYHIHNRGITLENKKWFNNLLYRFVFRNQKVILLSENLYYDVEKYVPHKNVFICPNGIKDYQPTTELLSLPDIKPFNILFFSNLMLEKGVFVLIDACAKLHEKGIYFRCDFVGGEADVSKEQFCKYVEQRGLSEHIQYLGKRYGKLKVMTFEQADVFVLPSKCDCFPLVLLEAMQHRLPIITANVGGMPDMVEDGYNGYLLDKYDDADTLADRLEYLFYRPELRRRMGINGRIKYERNFTIEIFEKRLLSILQQVIN